ncbi:E3 ubiquitin-protein ligase UPL1-like protein [Melia azedarach]|uniref:E3 ubiquitin-protein ligase UPL1-like protein n=1 Tax=Melia azedarach TaxID=155640 RepID=A0ACC1YYW6_MELAZ|nr:E3 ubiquitin-protein ligase UPL1-like protein [Melia azedarach]
MLPTSSEGALIHCKTTVFRFHRFSYFTCYLCMLWRWRCKVESQLIKSGSDQVSLVVWCPHLQMKIRSAQGRLAPLCSDENTIATIVDMGSSKVRAEETLTRVKTNSVEIAME